MTTHHTEAQRPSDASTDSTWVVIPAFNEGRGIAAVVAATLECFPNVVVIDDGSSDDTAAQALQAGAVVVTHPVNLGQGAALQTGFDWAQRVSARWVVTLDADGQHDPQDARRMLALAEIRQLDAVLGSRFLGNTVGMPRSRRLLLQAALRFQNLTTGLRLTDVHNGLRVLSARAIQHIELQQDRMAHASEIVSQLARSTLRIEEAPVTIRYTAQTLAKGQSAWGALHILIDLAMARLGRW